MRTYILKTVLRILVKLRWVYFHLHPGYVKFTVNAGDEEAYFFFFFFFHAKTNSIHHNYEVR